MKKRPHEVLECVIIWRDSIQCQEQFRIAFYQALLQGSVSRAFKSLYPVTLGSTSNILHGKASVCSKIGTQRDVAVLIIAETKLRTA